MMLLPLLARAWSAGRFGIELYDAFGALYSLEAARALMQERVQRRAESFLSLCRAIFSNPGTPYHWLLEGAGYTWERVRELVRARGLEGTLAQLATEGVYLDINEFKGKKPVVRGGRTRHFSASEVDSPQTASLDVQSSGSSGRPMSSLFGISALRLQASFVRLVADVLHVGHLPVVLYYPFWTGMVHLFTFTLAGSPPAAWFSQVPVKPVWRPGLDRRLVIPRLVAALRSTRFPARRFADIHHPAPLASWLHQSCPHGALVATYPASALHLLRAARAEAIDLPPLTFAVGGEPITDRKRAILENAGHRVFPVYGAVETGRIALGCLRPKTSDDMHVLVDRLAVVNGTWPRDGGGTRRGALLVTTLSPSAHKVLLNVETGDSGVLEDRACACPWEDLGLSLHIHSVRSFEKLTMEGMTFMAEALGDLVESVLPAQFGGSAADYQFREEEGPDGLTRLVLLVDPTISVDERLLHGATLAAVRAKPGADGMVELLDRASTLTIRRESPQSISGKILPLR